MSLTPEDRARRRDAKPFNERLKLVASVLNASCIGVLGAAIILPAVNEASLEPDIFVWLVAAIVLHLIGQAFLTFYRSED